MLSLNASITCLFSIISLSPPPLDKTASKGSRNTPPNYRRKPERSHIHNKNARREIDGPEPLQSKQVGPPQHPATHQCLRLCLDSRGASVPEAIPQPESLDRPRRLGRVPDEEIGASDSQGVDRPEAKDPPERSNRLRHPQDEKVIRSYNMKNPTMYPSSLGPFSADVFPTPELEDSPWRWEEIGRGTDKGWLSHTPRKDDEGIEAGTEKVEGLKSKKDTTSENQRTNEEEKEKIFGGHPGLLSSGGKSHLVLLRLSSLQLSVAFSFNTRASSRWILSPNFY